MRTLKKVRSHLRITKPQIAAINDVIAPLIVHKHHSINHVYIAHPEVLPMSKSTFYKYVDLCLFNIKNVDLPRKVRFKVHKEYGDRRERRTVRDKGIKIGRFYRDFQDYLELNPTCSVVEIDTVIGTAGGKGGKCFLTLLFRSFNLMLIKVLPYKRTEYVTTAFQEINELLGDEQFKRLFEVSLTDNGTEFSDPESIEISTKTGDRLSKVFFCNPNSS